MPSDWPPDDDWRPRMATITETIEVDRVPEDVFSYVTDASRFGE